MLDGRLLRVWGCLVAALATVACASQPTAPALVSLESRICTTGPDLVSALPLDLQSDKPVSLTLGADSPCLIASDGTKRIYAVFSLPLTSDDYIISVTSIPVGYVLFSPHVQMLDFNGAARRELPRSSFLFHGRSLYGALRSHDDERFLLITSDTQTIGSSVSKLVGSTHQSMGGTSTGGYFYIYTGSEATNVFTYAHNGKLEVMVRRPPKVN